ncbi:MAG: hypothetical protein AVDCRST_MAG90-804, partial [uncultured Microvirga sp.]
DRGDIGRDHVGGSAYRVASRRREYADSLARLARFRSSLRPRPQI